MSDKHIHFIGICGVAMAPLAKMFKDMGWKVTGSDKGFFPPVSEYLRANKIEFWPGWHPETLRPFRQAQGGEQVEPQAQGDIDLVVIGNFVGLNNPEFQFIKEQKIPYKSYPEIVAEYIIKPQSIVVAGTYGKTTISACLAWILEQAGLNPSYMSGGLLHNFPDGARTTDSLWSVVEGDEYSTSRWDPRPKFAHYKSKYLVLTSTIWDHTDIYHTKEEYLEVFKQLVASVPKDGLIVYNEREVTEEVIKQAVCRKIQYEETLSYIFSDRKKYKIDLHTNLIGKHNEQNICAAATLAHELGISDDTIQKSIASFKGVRRRLEIRVDVKGIKVIDDLAHSPPKARASIAAVRETYPKSRIRVVFEPNIGSRTKEVLPSFHGAFDQADEVYIPQLSKAKKSADAPEWISGEELVNYISESVGANGCSLAQITYEPNDEELINKLVSMARIGDVVLFMGSHGFRGMIEETIQRLKSNPSLTSP